ncbi:hypothetical protein P170DRAFT_435538 [Aspergillus steynii IBT 23096]|uniref:Uncharacterized protein n=1 Tax=Aspergillus steynii IBT 23096 TaxID=1392250 RepID=A0A2I2GBS6_9EURO|nr:uncharacterized protein P170DRAFT_435538 [Aspergillus steynii IBT 23096]PLB50342.1 hypothetical protein P170DRAFT_435538 [Aspergillus steynii IBT 23096]
MGHTIKRCPTAGESGEMDTGNTDTNDFGGAGGWGAGETESKDEQPTDGGGGGWGSGAATTATWD